jgi:tRNA pseudouridine65 synthase
VADSVLEILFQDDDLVIVNKPAGLAVHRSKMVGNADEFLIDLLREQVEGRLHLAHRLDRATSGVILIARSSEVAAALGEQFMGRSVRKRYLAVVRGWPDPEEASIDYPLPGSRETGPRREARTDYRRLATTEVDIALGRYPQQRYALVMAEPQSGRFRQIRKHMAHIHHPLIGDSQHGRGDHNALRLDFDHPVSGVRMAVDAPLDETWNRLLQRFQWQDAANTSLDRC